MDPDKLPISLQGPLDSLMKVLEEKIRNIANKYKDHTVMANRKMTIDFIDLLSPYNIKVNGCYPHYENGVLTHLRLVYQFKPLTLDLDFKENTEEK